MVSLYYTYPLYMHRDIKYKLVYQFNTYISYIFQIYVWYTELSRTSYVSVHIHYATASGLSYIYTHTVYMSFIYPYVSNMSCVTNITCIYAIYTISMYNTLIWVVLHRFALSSTIVWSAITTRCTPTYHTCLIRVPRCPIWLCWLV